MLSLEAQAELQQPIFISWSSGKVSWKPLAGIQSFPGYEAHMSTCPGSAFTSEHEEESIGTYRSTRSPAVQHHPGFIPVLQKGFIWALVPMVGCELLSDLLLLRGLFKEKNKD